MQREAWSREECKKYREIKKGKEREIKFRRVKVKERNVERKNKKIHRKKY